MWSNEILLLVVGICSAGLVVTAWKFDKERLYSAILVFLILISLVGGKTAFFFGHETNTGNIFYASVYLATYFLIERYGKREGARSIWIGIVGVVFFSLLLQIAIAFTGAPDTANLSSALTTALTPVTRLAFASLLAYLCSQSLNVYLYARLKQKYGRRFLWLRANASNFIAQILDSAVFFTVAFWGVLAPGNILDILLTGFLTKVIFILITSPLLYLNTIEEDADDNGYASVTLR